MTDQELVHSPEDRLPTEQADGPVLVDRLKARRFDDPLFLEAAVALSWIPWNDRAIVRGVVAELVDEIVAAERGKATTRASRKRYAKDQAVNRLLAVLTRLVAPLDERATGDEGRKADGVNP